VKFSTEALEKLRRFRQDIITGDPDLSLHPASHAKEKPKPGKAVDPEEDEKVARGFVRARTIRWLGLQSLFGNGPITWDWLNNEAAKKSLDVIKRAEDVIYAQATKRMPRSVAPRFPRGTVAAKFLAEDRLGFNPCFFHTTEFHEQLCFTW